MEKHEILQEKIYSTLQHNEEKNKRNFITALQIAENIEDNIITLNGTRPVIFDDDTSDDIKFQFGDIESYLHDNAITQLASKLQIPTKYVKDLSRGGHWQRNLVSSILTEHLKHTKRERMLIRSVDDQIRAILSDKYRRLNSNEILSNFIQASQIEGAIMYDSHISDIRSYVEMIHPGIVSIPSNKNGTIHVVFGIRMSNSDFGAAAFDIRSYMMQVVCLNGMVGETLTRQVHLGKRLPDDLQLSNRTYELDTQAQVSLTNDLVTSLFSKNAIERKSMEIQDATEIPVNMESEIKKLTKVANPLRKEETKKLEEIFMQNDPNDGVQGESTLFKLIQGVSALGNKTESEERKRDLHEISGNLLNRLKTLKK